MHSLYNPFLILWVDLTTSLSVQIFVISAVILFAGLLLLSWLNAHHLVFLNLVSISDIETEHPHLPSFRVIVVIFLCCVALLAVALQTMNGLPPFHAPFRWLYLAAFFVLSAAGGILGELWWKGTRDIAFGIIIGTVIAFLFQVFKNTLPLGKPLEMAAYLTLLVLSGGLAWRDLYRSWSSSVQAVAISVFILWILVYML